MIAVSCFKLTRVCHNLLSIVANELKPTDGFMPTQWSLSLLSYHSGCAIWTSPTPRSFIVLWTSQCFTLGPSHVLFLPSGAPFSCSLSPWTILKDTDQMSLPLGNSCLFTLCRAGGPSSVCPEHCGHTCLCVVIICFWFSFSQNYLWEPNEITVKFLLWNLRRLHGGGSILTVSWRIK